MSRLGMVSQYFRDGATLDNLIHDLKCDEGFSSQVYTDSLGLLTIGYGTLIEYGITREEAELLLLYRLGEVLRELHRRKPEIDEIDRYFPVQYAALINMAYNLGVPKLLGFRKMWKAIDERDWSRAADEALDSKWARQVPERARRIAADLRF